VLARVYVEVAQARGSRTTSVDSISSLNHAPLTRPALGAGVNLTDRLSSTAYDAGNRRVRVRRLHPLKRAARRIGSQSEQYVALHQRSLRSVLVVWCSCSRVFIGLEV
jgi:hypothetical protein